MPRVPSAAAAAASLLGLAAAAAGHPGPAPVRAAASPTIGFDTPAIVDPIRQGYEPDIAIDPHHPQTIYVSMPQGAPTSSFLYRSDDGGRTFRIVEGQVAGQGTRCPGGGDTELAVDPVNSSLYFADLQSLNGYSNSVSTDGGHTFLTTCQGIVVPNSLVDRQWYAIDSNGGKSAVGNGSGTAANAGRLYFIYDNVFENTSTGAVGQNQLVVNESTDGLHFGGRCVAAACGPAANLTPSENLPGNIVVDDSASSPHQHSVYVIHTSTDLGAVIVSRCRGAAGDSTAQQVGDDCTDPTAVNPADPGHINKYWADSVVRPEDVDSSGKPADNISQQFPTMAVDTNGNLYAAWSDYPATVTTNPASTSTVYHGPGRIRMAVSTDGGVSWSAPVTVSPPELNNNVQPWIVAGDPGRVDIAWYGAPQLAGSSGALGPESLDNGVWNMYMAQSINALDAAPAFTRTTVSDHPTKFAGVSTSGFVPTGGPDRSLGDFMQLKLGPQGEAYVVYVDDVTVSNGLLGSSGPIAVARQNSGPSLYASIGSVARTADQPVGSVTAPAGDAMLGTAGIDTSAPAHLDIVGAGVAMADTNHLLVTLDTNDPNLAAHLGPDPTAGGDTNEWIVRWDTDASGAPASGQARGGSYFVDMEVAQGGAPIFFDGGVVVFVNDVTSPAVYTYGYPSGHAVTGSIHGGTISWTVPVADVGSPVSGSTLYAVHAFTATQTGASQAVNAPFFSVQNGAVAPPNLIDQARSFTAPLSVPGTNVPDGTALTLLGVGAMVAAAGPAWRRARRGRNRRAQEPGQLKSSS